MNGERTGWVLSAALHLGVAAVAFFGLPHLSRERPAPPPPIAIEFVKIADKTEVVAPKQEKTQEETAPEPKPLEAMAEPVPEQTPDVVPLPKPEPVAKEAPKPAPKPQITEREKLRTSVKVQSKPAPPKRLKSDRIAALINRELKKETAQVKDDEKKEDQVKAEKDEQKPDPLAALRRGRFATASLADALSQKVAGCWTFPRGAKGIEDMSVTIRIFLLPDGKLSRQPEFIGAGDLNDPDRGFFRTFAESARRAVQLCQPYTEAMEYLPAGTAYIDFNFNGAEFGGGQ